MIQAGWEAVAGADSYTLVLTNQEDLSTQEVTIDDWATTTHAFTGLIPGQHYTIDLTAHVNGQDISGGQVFETTCECLESPNQNLTDVPFRTPAQALAAALSPFLHSVLKHN